MQQKLILCTSSFRHPYSLLLGHYRTTTAKSSKKIPKIKLKNMLNKTKSYNHWLRNVPQGTGTSNFIACEQALQVTLMARWKKEVELATTSLEFNFHVQFPCGSQSTGSLIFANQCEVETSTKVNKHWKTQAKGTWLHYWCHLHQSAFRIDFFDEIFKFHRRGCKLSFLFPPTTKSTPESLLIG